jgi:thiamine-phosphate pyrophosphorylase
MNPKVTFPSHFYGMVDSACPLPPSEQAERLLSAGARILQLRLKDAGGGEMLLAASAIATLCRAHGAKLIVNDRLDVALLADAAGVHLGQDDLPLEDARKLAPRLLIGISTHSVEQAVAAEAGGADYIGFGPVFPGGLKRNSAGKGLAAIKDVRAAVRLPIVAIGGITEQTAPSVIDAGADAVAIISDVLQATDINAKARAIMATLVKL